MSDLTSPEFRHWYESLLAQVRVSIGRFPLWADLEGPIRVFEDRDLPGMMRLGINEPTALFSDHNSFLRLWADDGLAMRHFDCKREGKLLRPFMPGVCYGLSHPEPLPYSVIDAIRSGRCARLQRLAGFQQILFHSSVNRVSYTLDVQGVKCHYDEKGNGFFPALDSLGEQFSHFTPAHLLWPNRATET